MNNETGIYDDKKTFEVNDKATDLVGGFMLLRQIDFSILHKNDTLALDGFLEDKVYHLKMIYMGIESVSTKVGRVPCHKLIPIMPDNKLFDGENSITVWISNDLNKIPVKMQAKMFIGYTGVELEQFRGLKHQLKIEASH